MHALRRIQAAQCVQDNISRYDEYQCLKIYIHTDFADIFLTKVQTKLNCPRGQICNCYDKRVQYNMKRIKFLLISSNQRSKPPGLSDAKENGRTFLCDMGYAY